MLRIPPIRMHLIEPATFSLSFKMVPSFTENIPTMYQSTTSAQYSVRTFINLLHNKPVNLFGVQLRQLTMPIFKWGFLSQHVYGWAVHIIAFLYSAIGAYCVT